MRMRTFLILISVLVSVALNAAAKPEDKGGSLKVREGWLDRVGEQTYLRAERPGVVAPSWQIEWEKGGAPTKLCLGTVAACPKVTLYYRVELKRGPATVLSGAFVGPSFEENVRYQKAYDKVRSQKKK